jgi:phospholipid/cholesterol/gamma-HCH transport system substrate-binding protein
MTPWVSCKAIKQSDPNIGLIIIAAPILLARFGIAWEACSMKNDVNTKATFAFVAFLLVLTVAGTAWYIFSERRYATDQIYTQDPVSGLVADAPIEFHGVEVGKVKSVRLVNSHSVCIVLSIEKTAPVTSASVATITSRGLATKGFTGYVLISLEDVGNNTQPLVLRPGERFPSIPTAP